MRERVVLDTERCRYFARCWLNQQKADSHKLLEIKIQLQKNLAEIKYAPWISRSTISDIEDSYDKILSEEYPQVLTHRNLGENTIDLGRSGEMERVSSWGNAAVLPFGMELEILFQAGGYEDLDGWIEYPYRAELYSAFWNEFWLAAKIEGARKRKIVRDQAETAAKIGVVLGIGSNFDSPLKFNRGAREEEIEAWFPKQEASPPRTEERYSLRPRSGNINYS